MDDCGKSTTIDDLPPEVLVRIFSSYVKSRGNTKLYKILSKVSIAWQKAALTPSLWTEMGFVAADFNHGHSWLKDTDVLERLPLVKSLHFRFMPHPDESLDNESVVTEALGAILESSWNLENFILEWGDFIDLPHFLADLPTMCPKITSIRIGQVHYIATDYLLLNWIEKYNTNLTSLILRHIHFDSYNLAGLSQKIAECCPNMATLEFTACATFFDFDLNSIQAKCPKIKELCFENVLFTDINDATSCALQLDKFSYLNDFDPPDGSALQQDIVWILKGSKRLKELQLVGLDPQVKTILQLPGKFLKTLSISHHGDNTRDLYNILCHWKHSLARIDAQCNRNSKQSLFRYIKQYGEDTLESFSLVCFDFLKLKQIKRVLRQCRKLKFLHITTIFSHYPDSIHDPILLSSRKEIDEWLSH